MCNERIIKKKTKFSLICTIVLLYYSLWTTISHRVANVRFCEIKYKSNPIKQYGVSRYSAETASEWARVDNQSVVKFDKCLPYIQCDAIYYF